MKLGKSLGERELDTITMYDDRFWNSHGNSRCSAYDVWRRVTRPIDYFFDVHVVCNREMKMWL